jgi:lysyl-tRNA synthetase, class II
MRMDVRRPEPATLIAWASGLAGLTAIVSAMTPEIASRSDLVQGMLPTGVPEAARVLTVSFGIVLVWLWRGLRRRKHRAWQLAVAVVLATAAAHLAKGLDFEESAISLVVLAALWRWRREFGAPGDPESTWPLVRNGVALGAVGIVLRFFELNDRLGDALTVLAVALGARVIYLWLRPLAGRVAQSRAQRVLAEQLVADHGTDSLAYFKLRHDKSWYFSPDGRAFLGYRVEGGTAVISGDPVGAAEDIPALLHAFREFARAQAWRVVALGVSAESVQRLRDEGFHSLYIGDEAIVSPETFSLEGRAIRKVRQSIARLERAGYSVRILRAGEADDSLRAEVARVSEDWLGRMPERGFAMAMDAVFAYPESLLAIAEDEGGVLGGYLHWVPSPASGTWSLAAMRRAKGTPNGLMESLIVESVKWAGEHGGGELSLNFAVFGDVLRCGSGARAWKRAFRSVLLRLDRLFQLERLNGFNRKFHPEWRPRYLCFESWGELPVVGLACLRAESLLTPPVLWGKRPEAA